MNNNHKFRQLLLFPDYKEPQDLPEEVYKFVKYARHYLDGFLNRNHQVVVVSLGTHSGPYGIGLAAQLIKNKGYDVDSMQIECDLQGKIHGLKRDKVKGRGIIIVADGKIAYERVRELSQNRPQHIKEICYLSHWPDFFEEFTNTEQDKLEMQLAK